MFWMGFLVWVDIISFSVLTGIATYYFGTRRSVSVSIALGILVGLTGPAIYIGLMTAIVEIGRARGGDNPAVGLFVVAVFLTSVVSIVISMFVVIPVCLRIAGRHKRTKSAKEIETLRFRVATIGLIGVALIQLLGAITDFDFFSMIPGLFEAFMYKPPVENY